MSNTREEVIAAVRAVFATSDAETVLALLDLYGTEPYEREKERVQLAIIELSRGDEDQLLYLLQVAKIDYRDILCWQASWPLTPAAGAKLQQTVRELMERWGRKL